eukprot:c25087_g1_i1 orf=98-325(-)
MRHNFQLHVLIQPRQGPTALNTSVLVIFFYYATNIWGNLLQNSNRIPCIQSRPPQLHTELLSDYVGSNCVFSSPW